MSGSLRELPARALRGGWFAVDLARAAAAGIGAARLTRARRREGDPAEARGASDEVHLLLEGDPVHGLSPAARYRAFQYVPLLEAEGLRVRVWPSRPSKYVTAGERFQRLASRSRPLAALAGAAIEWLQVANRRRDFRALAGRGVAFLQRDLLASRRAELERVLPLYCRHVVFDFDDALWVRPPWARGAAAKAAHGPSGDDAALRDKLAAICGLSTAVLAANEHLAAFARQHCPRVHVVPTALCTDEWRPGTRDATAAPAAKPVIGWAGTSGNLHYLRAIGPALRRLASTRDFTLRVVCNPAPESAFEGLPREKLDVVPWRAEGEVERVQRFDVGVMPLAADGWAEGKAGFKLVQYMACGVPFVASPVGANPATGGPDGECGLYAASEQEWTERLDALLGDAALREKLGAAGRARAVARFDRRVHAPAIAAVLREAARA